jgi:hypothetical protein
MSGDTSNLSDQHGKTTDNIQFTNMYSTKTNIPQVVNFMFICLPCVGVCLNGIAEAKHTIFVFNVFVFVDKIVIKYTTIEDLTIRKGKYFFCRFDLWCLMPI